MISQKLERIGRKLFEIPNLLLGNGFQSYSQVGEDRILDFLFNKLQIKKPTYLEIGTNHPINGNNTYYFYLRGSKGVLVEPDPKYKEIIRKSRPNDVLETTGIAISESSMCDFYVYPIEYSGWNTFSLEEVEIRKKEGINYEAKISVPIVPVNSILNKHFQDKEIDLLAIDVEGLDEEILRSYDFKNHSPRVICVEIIRFGDSEFVERQDSIIDFLRTQGYTLYASTNVNGIFVRKV
jgi:FkbM family methyltransferase